MIDSPPVSCIIHISGFTTPEITSQVQIKIYPNRRLRDPTVCGLNSFGSFFIAHFLLSQSKHQKMPDKKIISLRNYSIIIRRSRYTNPL